MTEKQERTIRFIENMLETKYEGETNYDAWKFIHDNLEFAQKCAYFESQMGPITTFSYELNSDKEPDIDLKSDISMELMKRDILHGKRGSEIMANFAENLFLENYSDIEIGW